MAKINSKILFLTTSPRTPEKMIPEISLLIKNFGGQKWCAETQREFMEVLRQEQFFNGKGEKDPAFSARDRINRGPKSLGFVQLSPTIAVTPAGEELIGAEGKAGLNEVFLRQLLKFQVPSPFHKPSAKAADFCVKPYLELLRLVRTLGTLKFDELQIFGMQLTDWRKFEDIVQKIDTFRVAKTQYKGNYSSFKRTYIVNELKDIYKERIAKGDIKTRESKKTSVNKFLATQAQNMRDYADAGFRYLQATGLVHVSHVGKSLSIVPDRIEDVDYLLKTISREPCLINDEAAYMAYLGSADTPKLLTDSKKALVEKLRRDFPHISFNGEMEAKELKALLANALEERKAETLRLQVEAIKDYRQYDDIQAAFRSICAKTLYDAPLMFEWNMWRAMTMLDGGDIKANLHFDDFGNPLSVAQGNMADIVCDYGDYMLIVEVTLASGQKQYEMEGEPVSRHLGAIKKYSGKPCYCLFVSPTINEACVAHFYVLHQMDIAYYGGKSSITPLPLHIFQKMLEDSFKADFTPTPSHVRSFFEHSAQLAAQSSNELEWYGKLQDSAVKWFCTSLT